ncbi:hypothetical protein [uncultured Limosilactobacillus sp.]|uniref:hypothetical protein n=1 Tax=uncultured Limosilactobacillus sp. TaxID=2837629 RepID=UPI0025ED16A0|nr:hypothetical protein [uncultured Limosilactobacillus sp.]
MRKLNDQQAHWWLADIGDYLKVIANGMVMLQPIIALTVKMPLAANDQRILASLYNLVKFTSPAFIFGIVFTVIRQSDGRKNLKMPDYARDQWANNFWPTLIWTVIYLLVMPNLQQREHYHNIATFCWQVVSGNAAPHLWYSVMMLQFLIIMPVIKWTTNYVGHNRQRLIAVWLIVTGIYGCWLWFYDQYVFNGPQANHWYLLNRLFISFLIFGFYGGLAWNFHKEIQRWLYYGWWAVVMVYVGTYLWTRQQFFAFHDLTNLVDDTYYRPSMAIYALAVIALIYMICIVQKVYQMKRSLKTIHFLAFYAYRAFLANVFWDRILWGLFLYKIASRWLLPGIFATWVCTWLCSYLSVYLLHQLWLVLINKIRLTC